MTIDSIKVKSLEERVLQAVIDEMMMQQGSANNIRQQARNIIGAYRAALSHSPVEQTLSRGDAEPVAWYRDPSSWEFHFALCSKRPPNNTSNPKEWFPLYASPIPPVEQTPAPVSQSNVPLGWTLISDKHYDALAEGLAEIKATSDGQSDQPIPDIINGIIAEIAEAPAPIQGVLPPLPQDQVVGIKQLDLSNMLRHAFLSGFEVAGKTITEGIGHWPDYNPENCPAYQRVCAALASEGQ